MNNVQKEPILEFIEVVADQTINKKALSFSLLAGEAAAIIFEGDYLPFADIAEGIIKPAAGLIKFMQKDWCEMSPDEEIKKRALIGRVFWDTGWISNLNVMENITLAGRHHTKQSVYELEQRAEKLARYFGMKEVPKGRPAFFKPSELRICEWIRAFLLEHRLIIVESPLKDLPDTKLPLITKEIEARQKGGGAFLFICDNIEQIKKMKLSEINLFHV